MNIVKNFCLVTVLMMSHIDYGMDQVDQNFNFTTNQEKKDSATNLINEWWTECKNLFSEKSNTNYSDEQVNQIIRLIRAINTIKNMLPDEFFKILQTNTNELKNNNSQLASELIAAVASINYIDQHPVRANNQNQFDLAARAIEQNFKFIFYQQKLSTEQQKHVLQILTAGWPRDRFIQAVVAAMTSELTQPKTTTKKQPVQRDQLTNNQQILQGKDEDLTWQTMLRNADDINQRANDLVATSYISLDMQNAVLSLFNQPVIMNSKTGKVKNIPDIESIINKSVELATQPMKKDTILQALHAAYQAIQIALFIASTEQLYSQEWIIKKPQSNRAIIEKIQEKKRHLENILYQTGANWSSYIWQTITLNNKFSLAYPVLESTTDMNERPIIEQDDLVISRNEVQKLLNNSNVNTAHDYKKLAYLPVNQANLLFEQCFIAQQHHIYFPQFSDLKIAPPTYRPAVAINVPAIINFIKAQEENFDIAITHQLLLDTRLAIQTALDIATKNSTYIGSSILNPIYIRDPLVAQLQTYDADLAVLVADPNYGATTYDSYYGPIRDYISVALIKGTFFAGAILAAYVAIYATYHHGQTMLTTASIPFHVTNQAVSWVTSTIKSNSPSLTKNETIDKAAEGLKSFNALVFGPSQTTEKDKKTTSTKSSNLPKITLPTATETKTMLENIKNSIDGQPTKSQTTNEPFSGLLPPPSSQTLQKSNSYIDSFKNFLSGVKMPEPTPEPVEQKNYIKEYFSPAYAQEKAAIKNENAQRQALWDATLTGEYNPNYSTQNQQTGRNIATGLTPAENKEFAPYAAGALAVGAAPLVGAAALGTLESAVVGDAAAQGLAQGFKNYGQLAEFAPTFNISNTAAQTAAQAANKIIPQVAAQAANPGTTLSQLAGNVTEQQIAGAVAGGTALGAGAWYAGSGSNSIQPISPTNPPTGPNHYGN